MNTQVQKIAASKAYGTGKGKKVPSYVEQEVLSWSKEKLILKMYDLFLVSNKRKDIEKMSKVLIELMGALNFDYGETSTRYQKKYDEAYKIIKELRDTWALAFKLEN